MADHSSEVRGSDLVVSQETANTSEMAEQDLSHNTMTANTSIGSDASLTIMTGTYEEEIVEIRLRTIPLIFRDGAYTREIPFFGRSIP